MAIYEFRPVEAQSAHRDWEASDYRGTCRVSADDERAARQYAARAFAKAANWSGQEIAMPPWHKPELVQAVFVISGAVPMPPDGMIMMPKSSGRPNFSAKY